MDVTVVDHQDLDLSSAMFVTGFASYGIPGTIASNFLVRSLSLPRVASVISDDFPPMAIVRDGMALSPMRIHSAPMDCGPGGDCDQLAVLVSDFIPKPEMIAPISAAILDWALEKRIELMVTLEGLRMDGDPADSPVYALGNLDPVKERLETMDAEFVEEAVMSGFSGILQYRGEILNIPVVSLLVNTQEDYPDARGAAKLVSFVGPLVPRLNIDPQPLFDEAERIEDNLVRSMRTQAETTSEISKQSRIMFG